MDISILNVAREQLLTISRQECPDKNIKPNPSNLDENTGNIPAEEPKLIIKVDRNSFLLDKPEHFGEVLAFFIMDIFETTGINLSDITVTLTHCHTLDKKLKIVHRKTKFSSIDAIISTILNLVNIIKSITLIQSDELA